MSQATGWGLVPPTVLRDGPLGPGACQLWIEEPTDAEPLVGFVPAGELPTGWLRVASARDEDGDAYVLAHADDPRLARLAVLDVGDQQRRPQGRPRAGRGRTAGSTACDHGVSFHVEHKLRTVLWGWAGRVLPDESVDVLGKLLADLRGDLGATLKEHLTGHEVGRVRARIRKLLETACYPQPGGDWPAVPWPPM